MARKVFISHKNNEDSNAAGAEIGDYLINELKYDVFFDKFNLEGGMNWNNEIIEALLGSDIVIVILDKETVESNWVQREIDMARARNISILPVTLHDEFDDIAGSLKRFDLEKTQFIHYPKALRTREIIEIVGKIGSRIEPLSLHTIENQAKGYEVWKENRKTQPDVRQKSRYAVYKLKENPDICEFVIVTGDATEIGGYDILVNTENDYMQMARFFETNTLSATIRWKGAEFSPGQKLQRDTIQQQINDQLLNMGVHELPVGECFVLPTFAGLDGSTLRSTGFTYIFHAAAVQINRISRKIRSLDPGANPTIVKNCMDLAKDVHTNNGAILYKDGTIMASASDKADIESMLIPVFGAGQGGNTLTQAVTGIVKGFKKYFEPKEAHPINTVGLCIYNFNDVGLVESIFEQENMRFEKVE